jgi:hypothetical protein
VLLYLTVSLFSCTYYVYIIKNYELIVNMIGCSQWLLTLVDCYSVFLSYQKDIHPSFQKSLFSADCEKSSYKYCFVLRIISVVTCTFYSLYHLGSSIKTRIKWHVTLKLIYFNMVNMVLNATFNNISVISRQLTELIQNWHNHLEI